MTTDFQLISRDALAEFRRQRQELGFTFDLPATSLGLPEMIKARVMRLSLLDKAAVQRLPQDAQEKVWAGLKAVRDERKKLERSGDLEQEPESLLEASMRNERIVPAANAYCIASFVAPKLTDDLRKVDNETWHVDDIELEDRVSFYLACNDADSDQAKKLKLFRPSGTVEAQGHVIRVADAGDDVPAYATGEAATATFRPADVDLGGVRG